MYRIKKEDMKTLLIVFVFLTIGTTSFCQGISKYPDSSHEYWMEKGLAENYSKKKFTGGKIKYPFESVVFDSFDGIYITTRGSEYIWHVGKINKNNKISRLSIDNTDTLYRNKDFLLKIDGDSLTLIIADLHQNMDTVIFIKPDPDLKQRDRDEVVYSYLLVGKYEVFSTGTPLQKDTVSFMLDGRVSGLVSIASWDLGHLSGVTKPETTKFRGVLDLRGEKNKSYYALFDFFSKSWAFYNYTRDKMSVYHLAPEPDIILRFIE